ncbi:MAG: hypothetical protein Q8919_08520 [Bacteroidota bacterium]|nr:hypothetical protein [Bacteroidota bacterium]
MKNSAKLLFSVAVLAVVFAADSALAQSCPMCKESMTQAGAKLSDGFYYSIMSMFSLPITMIGAGTVFVMRSSWIKQHPESKDLSFFGVMKEIAKEKMGRKG